MHCGNGPGSGSRPVSVWPIPGMLSPVCPVRSLADTRRPPARRACQTALRRRPAQRAERGDRRNEQMTYEGGRHTGKPPRTAGAHDVTPEAMTYEGGRHTGRPPRFAVAHDVTPEAMTYGDGRLHPSATGTRSVWCPWPAGRADRLDIALRSHWIRDRLEVCEIGRDATPRVSTFFQNASQIEATRCNQGMRLLPKRL